jgi:tetratricopeptide (TPR) repeat protein
MAHSVTLYQPEHHALAPRNIGVNPKVLGLDYVAWVLWFMGSPEQALTRSLEALQFAQELAHPQSIGYALSLVIRLCLERGEGHVAQERGEALVVLSSENELPVSVAWGTAYQGAALIRQGQWTEGVAKLKQGLEAYAGETWRIFFLAWLAAGYGKVGQVEEGLAAIAEALRLVEKRDERIYEAEVWRIKGELLLMQAEKLSN